MSASNVAGFSFGRIAPSDCKGYGQDSGDVSA